ncbi:MAG: hypothetical protein DYG99_16555 [Bacteroidetes bacterium CHB5]|nr:hypothetical protein [Bacteroidetes bacterium CHB5]
MENNKSTNPFYFLFFMGYFMAQDFGDTRTQRDSALYFVMVNLLGLGISILFLLKFLGINFNNSIAILSLAGVIAILCYLVFTRSFVAKQLSNYSYIGMYSKRKRMILIFFIFLGFISLLAVSTLINNEDIKEIIFY